MTERGGENRKRILADHKQTGKKFIPPFVHKLPEIHEVKWVDRPLPELFWLAVLNDALGFHRGAELASSIAKSTSSTPGVRRSWFAPVSAYSTLSQTQMQAIVVTLEAAGHLEDLRRALNPLVALYPECPLMFLYNSTPHLTDRPIALKHLRSLMAGLFDKTTKAAIFMQANAIYMAFVTDLLVVSPDVSLAKFPAIQEYPDTDESQKVASSVRASISAFFGITDISETWPRYFWNRGLEIDDCFFDTGDHDE